MTYLSKLPENVQQICIRLPFRVGLFISESDQTGGDESAEAERKALENIVTFYVEDTVKSEFAHEVMLQTLYQKNNWSVWSENIADVVTECLNLTSYLEEHIDAKEILAFKQNLIEDGLAVAQAYCEFEKESPQNRQVETYVSLFFKKLQSIFSGEEKVANDYALNISPAERKAIELISNNLGIHIRF